MLFITVTWKYLMMKHSILRDIILQTRQPLAPVSSLVLNLPTKIDYYELNMTPPSPNLLPVATYPLLETRHRKHIKLAVLREKQLAQQQDLEDDQLSEQMILSQLNHSNFSARSTEKQEDSQQDVVKISYRVMIVTLLTLMSVKKRVLRMFNCSKKVNLSI